MSGTEKLLKKQVKNTERNKTDIQNLYSCFKNFIVKPEATKINLCINGKIFLNSIRIIKFLFVSLRPDFKNQMRLQNTLRYEFNECC